MIVISETLASFDGADELLRVFVLRRIALDAARQHQRRAKPHRGQRRFRHSSSLQLPRPFLPSARLLRLRTQSVHRENRNLFLHQEYDLSRKPRRSVHSDKTAAEVRNTVHAHRRVRKSRSCADERVQQAYLGTGLVLEKQK